LAWEQAEALVWVQACVRDSAKTATDEDMTESTKHRQPQAATTSKTTTQHDNRST
jgi:hypothetical protein